MSQVTQQLLIDLSKHEDSIVKPIESKLFDILSDRFDSFQYIISEFTDSNITDVFYVTLIDNILAISNKIPDTYKYERVELESDDDLNILILVDNVFDSIERYIDYNYPQHLELYAEWLYDTIRDRDETFTFSIDTMPDLYIDRDTNITSVTDNRVWISIDRLGNKSEFLYGTYSEILNYFNNDRIHTFSLTALSNTDVDDYVILENYAHDDDFELPYSSDEDYVDSESRYNTEYHVHSVMLDNLFDCGA